MNRAGVIMLAISALLTAVGCNNDREDIILDINSIVNRTPQEVEEILGEPDSAYTYRILGNPTYCQLYKKNNIEIQYPDDRATDIVIYGPHDLPFNQTALSAFKLDYKKQHPAEYRRNGYIRWEDFENFSVISFYNPKLDSLDNVVDFNIFFKVKESEDAN